LILLYAVGAQTLLGVSSRLVAPRVAAPMLLLSLILISGGLTTRDYFTRWAASRGLGNAFSLEMQLAADTAARWLAESAQDQPILLSNHLFVQPQMVSALGVLPQAMLPVQTASAGKGKATRFLLESSFDPRQPMFLVWRGANGLVSAALDPLSASEAQTISQMLVQPSSVQVIGAPNHQERWPRIFSGVLPESVQLQPRRIASPLDVRFANGVRLVGYDVQPDTSAAGEEPTEFQLTLFWEVDENTAEMPSSAGRSLILPMDTVSGCPTTGRLPRTICFSGREDSVCSKMYGS
jgi:hypothetical protein